MQSKEFWVKSLVVALLLPALAGLESAVLSGWSILGVTPWLTVYVVAAVAVYEGPVAGAVCGFAAGLLMDGLGDKSLCIYTLQLLLWGCGIGLASPVLFRTRVVTVILWGAVCGFLVTLFRLFCEFYLFSQIDFGTIFVHSLLQTLYSAALSPLVVWPVAVLHKKFMGEQRLFR